MRKSLYGKGALALLAASVIFSGCAQSDSSQETTSAKTETTTVKATEEATTTALEEEKTTKETTVAETTAVETTRAEETNQAVETTAEPNIVSLHKDEWISDIENVLRPSLAGMVGVSEKLSDEAREAFLDNLISELEAGNIKNDEEVYYSINMLLSLIGQSSVKLKYNIAYYTNDSYNKLPIWVKYYADGYYLCGTEKEYEQYFGYKVISINDVPIEEFYDRYDDIIINETYGGFISSFEKNWNTGYYIEELNFLDIVDKDMEKVPVVLEDSEGKAVTVELKPMYEDDEYLENFHFIEEYGYTLPYYLQSANSEEYAPFEYFIMDEYNNLYFLYNVCWDSTCPVELGGVSGNPDFASFFDGMMEELAGYENIKTIIIDLRNNYGGYGSLWDAAVEKYKDVLKNYSLRLLVGGTTYGGAQDFIDTTLYNFDNVTIYGGETGQSIKNYRVSTEVEMPKTGCTLLIDTAEVNTKCLDKKYDNLQEGVIPDVEVYQYFSDFVNGYDTVLEAASEDLY